MEGRDGIMLQLLCPHGNSPLYAINRRLSGPQSSFGCGRGKKIRFHCRYSNLGRSHFELSKNVCYKYWHSKLWDMPTRSSWTRRPLLSSDHPFSVHVIERSLQNKKMACVEVMPLRLAAHLNRWIDSLEIRRDRLLPKIVWKLRLSDILIHNKALFT